MEIKINGGLPDMLRNWEYDTENVMVSASPFVNTTVYIVKIKGTKRASTDRIYYSKDKAKRRVRSLTEKGLVAFCTPQQIYDAAPPYRIGDI